MSVDISRSFEDCDILRNLEFTSSLEAPSSYNWAKPGSIASTFCDGGGTKDDAEAGVKTVPAAYGDGGRLEG
jgi:hypothetical protein